MEALLAQIKSCTLCAEHLFLGANPVVAASPKSKIALIGQAPGSIVHETGIPWDDKSGERLRMWLNVTDKEFYNPDLFALIPMGFCYPGKGKSGDLPPRPECAPKWHDLLFEHTKDLKLIILIGQYAQNYYLRDRAERTLTETVKNYELYLPKFLPLPHPSPRNNIWLKKNPWFDQMLIPQLQSVVRTALNNENLNA
jgi:uracil-DNA glycosylase